MGIKTSGDGIGSQVSKRNYKYRNLTGATAIDITDDITYFRYLNYNSFTHICLCNVHSTDSCTVDLYASFEYFPDTTQEHVFRKYGHINNDYTEPTPTTDIYYYFKNVTIPAGVTLKLTNEDIYYDTESKLYIKLGESGSTVDISISGTLDPKNPSALSYDTSYSGLYETDSPVETT